ncbi:MAG: phosphatase PAP2 family protein [Alphaproteobacteria bacterium]|nr:phosphatase PAP2 family protein [Alphaproteobacteria bacterium]
MSTANSDIDDIRYPIEEWDLHLLKLIDKGPVLLKDSEEFIPEPFPANSSEETQGELDYLVELSKTARDTKTLNMIFEENDKFFVWQSFADAGILVEEDQNEAFEKVMETLNRELGFFILKYKKYYSRPRPSQLRPSLERAIDNPGHAAYPSGHATQSYAAGLILSKMDEENTDKYLDAARAIAHRREIAGVHYPSDSKAGQILAEKIVNKLLELQKFQTQLQQAKESFIKAPGLDSYEMQMVEKTEKD